MEKAWNHLNIVIPVIRKALKEITILNGVFTSAEMKEVITSLIFSKINFHHIKNLKSIVNDGIEDDYSVKKISELYALKAEINALNFDENAL